jgi:hypothetical protein
VGVVLQRFIDDNWRNKYFAGMVGGISEKLAEEHKRSGTSAGSIFSDSLIELNRRLSDMNESVRGMITRGRTPDLVKIGMTADSFERAKPVEKSVNEFLEQDLLSPDPTKAAVAFLTVAKNGLGLERSVELMKMLLTRYYFATQGDETELGKTIRTINANLAGEYTELKGKLEGQDTFRRMNLP